MALVRRARSNATRQLVLDAALAALPQQVLARIELLTAPHEGRLSRDHARMLGMIRQHAGPNGSTRLAS